MGWSCSSKAGAVMSAWQDFCVKNSGTSNVYSNKGKTYFWEVSRTEHDDGSITGIINVQVGETKPDGSFLAKKCGTFKINGDGTIARAPLILKLVALKAPIPPNKGIGSGG